MKLLLIPCLFFIGFAQTGFSQSDLLVLKQRNHIIQTWIPGSMIDFQFSSGQWLQGIIKTVRNDSIIMEQIQLQRVGNQFGFATIDTARFGIMKFHVSEIYGMPKNDHASIFTNGALLLLGSGAYILLNLINTGIHKEQLFSPVNGTRLGIASLVFGAGMLLSMTHQTYIRLGKRYTMQTLRTK